MKFFCIAVAAIASFPAQAQENPIEVGARTCIDSLSRRVSADNPEKMRIGEPVGGKVELVDYHGQKVMARKFSVLVNGAPWTCTTSADGRRILQAH
jgi:hypothetical protein